MNTEPAWIEHDGSAVCPVPAGHDVERKYDDDKICRGSNPQICNWRCITHYRDWTAFAKEQEAMGKDVPEWAWKCVGEIMGYNTPDYRQWKGFDNLAAYIAAAHATIHQLGGNAAKAAGEYAEEVGRLKLALKGLENAACMVGQWRTTIMVRFDGKLDWGQWNSLNSSFDRLEANAALARAALTEPTDG